MTTALLGARLILAVVFVVAAAAKLADRKGSRQAVRDFGIPEGLAGPVASALPVLELVVAAILLPRSTARWGALGALLLLGLFTVAIAVNLARGNKPDCRCFGQIQASPIGSSTLLRNAVLGGLAAWVAWNAFDDRPGRSVGGFFGELTTGEVLGIVAGLALAALGGLIAWFMSNLLAQQGRMLMRFDDLQDSLKAVQAALAEEGFEAAGSAPEPLKAAGGHPVGTKAPDFSLKGLYGETLTLEALLAPEKPLLLIFSDPACGPCATLMPDIARWQSDYADRLSVALISRGNRDENRKKAAEHGVRQVLLQKDYEVAESYIFAGTPSAVVVNPDQTIGSVLVAGSENVRRLVVETVGEPQPAPAALGNGHVPHAPTTAEPPMQGVERIGQPAPLLSLPDVDGNTVELSDFRGDYTLLLFWNPGCGFCQQMLPDLQKFDANPPAGAPKLAVLSTGSPEDNRAMGLSSPVLHDTSGVANAYSAGGTPMGVLVDPQGNIASGVAAGAQQVWSLTRNPSSHAAAKAAGGAPAGGAEQVIVPPAEMEGIEKIGQPAPPIRLPDLEGNTVDLADFRGDPTMVLFWNPGCGFCQQMLPDLKKFDAEPPPGSPRVLVVSSGSVDDNRAMGLRSPVVVDPDFSVGTAYEAGGTPMAVMVDAEGNIASGVAAGAQQVWALAKDLPKQQSNNNNNRKKKSKR